MGVSTSREGGKVYVRQGGRGGGRASSHLWTATGLIPKETDMALTVLGVLTPFKNKLIFHQ